MRLQEHERHYMRSLFQGARAAHSPSSRGARYAARAGTQTTSTDGNVHNLLEFVRQVYPSVADILDHLGGTMLVNAVDKALSNIDSSEDEDDEADEADEADRVQASWDRAHMRLCKTLDVKLEQYIGSPEVREQVRDIVANAEEASQLDVLLNVSEAREFAKWLHRTSPSMLTPATRKKLLQ